jgi:uncharacterized membrane protein
VYCREVTKVWCAFFLVNSLVSSWTVFFESLDMWMLYNGFIAYIAIGALFVIEYFVRSVVMVRNENA